MRGHNRTRTLNLNASWQEGAKKRELREKIAEVKRGRVLEDVWDSVKAAFADHDFEGVLKWEGRMEELLEHLTEVADCDLTEVLDCLDAFLDSLMLEKGPAINPQSALPHIRLRKRRVELLGKMERFRDQGEAMCGCGTMLVGIGQRQEGERYFQKARDVGAAHGFFMVESQACIGLGKMSVLEGRREEGLDLMRNSVVAARLGEGDADSNELYALTTLIPALFEASAIDEVEPLLPRFQELSNSDDRGSLLGTLRSLLFNARLHEVLCIYSPVLGTPSSCPALAFRQRR